MKTITLGSIIEFKKTSTLEYNEKQEKVIVKHNLKAPYNGMVVGKVRKATGTYCPGGFEEPPSLKNKKFHEFYEVKASLINKPVLVHIDDVHSVVDTPCFPVPHRNDLVFEENQKIHSEGNNGGDFFEIEEIEEGLIKIESGSCCVYNHQGIYPTEYLTRLLEYASINLTPEQIFSGWNKEYVQELMEKIK